MERMIAFCGLVCTECAGYLATQANDWAELEQLAAKARAEYNAPPTTTAKDIQCDGCLSDTGRKNGYCAVCEIRACGVARGVANCGHCPDYACEKLTAFLGMAPASRGVLDEIHAAL